MALRLVAGSTQGVRFDSIPAITYPFTLGVWANSTTFALTVAWVAGFCASANTSNYANIGRATAAWSMRASSATATTTNLANGTANQWAFMLVRFIAAANRRGAIYLPEAGGAVTLASNTTNEAATVNRLSIGRLDGSSASEAFDGRIAEFWWANCDVGLDSAANMTAGQVMNIAHNGPFAHNYIAANLVEYRSFRDSVDCSSPDETFSRFGLRPQPQGVPTIGAHVPYLAAGYQGPSTTLVNVTV
jgi:hypothetical protein